ncbi:MAG: exodeoxyribonuclease VII large subunit [Chloroflexi bacterium]|nr:exodeoxyribonuclease VII large subunit [Chloroflexota bacterium]
MPETTITVSALVMQIKTVLEGSLLLQGVSVEGEVSNVTRAASGHWYFTLKDAGSQIRCVMWRGVAERQPVNPENGASLVAVGDVTVYPQRGEMQLQVTGLHALGVGDLYARLELLRLKLAADGLFDVERKQPLPALPFRIGIVTSPDAAAFQDVLNVLRRRHPLAEIILAPTLVQGVDAPPQIVRALESLDNSGQIDVLMIVRGGGSIEDLWAFNDERVVRALAACITPTIAGVGHETDTTLVDYAADVRAPTPSAAAELVSTNAALLPQFIATYRGALDSLLADRIASQRVQIDDALRQLIYASPLRKVDSARQMVDTLSERMTSRLTLRLSVARERTIALVGNLEAASPLALLKRGYALVRRADGSTVRAVGQVSDGELLSVQVHDGAFDVRAELEKKNGQPRLAGF